MKFAGQTSIKHLAMWEEVNKMNDFLPKDYEVPVGASKYMQLEDGENRFRVLSSAIIGWEYWTQDQDGNRAPVRVKTYNEVPDSVKHATDNRNKAKHFWAFVVYNFTTKEIQILEFTQKTIMRSVESLVNNPKWGSPKDYTITIIRSKTGSKDIDVEYSVMPEPKEALDKSILKLYEDMHINLNALYVGEDPFNGKEDVDINDIPEDLAKS